MSNNELKVLGRVVGTFDGWDEVEGLFSSQFYNFVPAKGFDMPEGTLYIAYDDGTFETYDVDGEVSASKDILTVMNGLAAIQHRNS